MRQKLIRKKQQRDEEASRAQGLEFERLPSLQKSASEEQRKAVRESENRVRMFARELGRDADSIAEAPAPAPQPTHLRTPSNARVPQFHRPMPPKSVANSNMTSNVTEVGIAIDPEDPVVQYESQNKKHSRAQESISERRFVNEHLPPPKPQDTFLSDSSG